jgi:DeoR/GlpR family transcriptional regulator of sugar metabolism
MIGGEFLEEASENVGPLVVEQIKEFTAQNAVITVGTIDPTGAMDYELRESEIAKAMIARARRVTVIADASKLNRSALFRVCTLNDIHRLVVNEYPDLQLAEALCAAGVEIVVPQNDRKVA